jgi:signal transduction histidine kinase
MQRAVSNLVSNAVTHTLPGGSVVLSTNAEGSAIRIEVSDTGVGIPPEALPRVFDRFFRADTSRSQASGGTGLGLAIVQSIALLHGGNVEIASQVGQGTQVTLRVPTGPPPPDDHRGAKLAGT